MADSDSPALGPQESPTDASLEAIAGLRNPLARPYAEARVLAAYLTAESIPDHVPHFEGLTEGVRTLIHERIGRGAEVKLVEHAGRPRMRRADQPEVRELLQQVGTTPGPRTHQNLCGFEWVEVDSLIAGHLATPGVPLGRHAITTDANAAMVGAFCMRAAPQFGLEDIVFAPNGDVAIATAFRHAVQLHPEPFVLDQQTGALMVRYNLTLPLRPIRVLHVLGRAIAVGGLEKLVALAQMGIREALCIVSYGYGIDALGSLPTTPEHLLNSNRPPLIQDFVDDYLAVSVPVRSPATLTYFRSDTVSVGSG
jgi:hypothetical protein